jgi:hypothetical protein
MLNKFLTYLLYVTPIFFILGNPFINLFVLAICLSFYYVRINYKFIDKKLIYLLILFSLILFIGSASSNYLEYSLTKSLSYLRFFILLIILPLFIKKIEINLKNMGIIFLSIVVLVIFDTLIQLFLGKDIFGYPIDNSYNRLSGPFGDELIVGHFVFYFSFISLALILKSININSYFLFLFFLIIGIFAFITGERNTFLSYFIFMFFLIFFSKKKITIILSCIVVILISTSLFLNFERFNHKYSFNQIQTFQSKENDNKQEQNQTSKVSFFNKINDKVVNSIWFSHYRGGLKIFEKNKLYGSGFKTFRYQCRSQFSNEKLREQSKIICTSHPHNIYIELLSDTGILGFGIFLIICLYYLLKSIKNNWSKKNLSASIINCLFITFLFPFKPHGSLFSTSTAFILWFIFSLLILDLISKKFDKPKILQA